ncbi:HD-GYP domain-containing protein [Bdellovibrio bacteriovorus]
MSQSAVTVDILVGSSQDSFWNSVTAILKGYYPYQLKKFADPSDMLDEDEGGFNPLLALIDGQAGFDATNEWVQSTKMKYPKARVIVLHAFQQPLDFNVLRKNGCDEIMHISFDREFISDMVLQLAPIEMTGDHIPITALMPVDLRDLDSEVEINFDVFVHLPANHRSVLIRKKGGLVEEKQLEKFHNLKQQMYIRKTEMKAFFEYARQVLTLRNGQFPISMTEKFHRTKKSIYEIMTQFFNNAPTDFQEGRIVTEKCKGIIAELELCKDMSTEDLAKEIFRYAGNSRSNYHDCICLAAYGAFFAQLLGWSIEKRENIAMAGLLHNIGLSQMHPSTAEKDFKLYTAEEKEQYHLYPDRSVIMVKSKKVPLNVETSEAIGQHRELCNGGGFPKKLNQQTMSEVSKLLSFAFRFHELTALQDKVQAATPLQALALLKENAVQGSGDVDLISATQIFKKLKA